MSNLGPYECRQQRGIDCPLKQIVVDGIEDCKEVIEDAEAHPSDIMFILAAEAQLKLQRGEELLEREATQSLGDCSRGCQFGRYVLMDMVNPYFNGLDIIRNQRKQA